MACDKGCIGVVIGTAFIIVGFLFSMLLTGITTDEERFDKFGTLLLILGGIIAGAFFSRQISCRT